MRLALCFFALIATSFAVADDFATFAANDKLIGKGSIEGRDKRVEENLAILVRAVKAAEPADLQKVLDRFGDLAKKNDDGYATSFGWVQGSKMTDEHTTVVCVSYGPIGRVQVFESTYLFKGGTGLEYMVQRSPRPLLLHGGSLVIASSFVRDAGVRDNTRLDFIGLGLGRRLTANHLTILKSVDAEHTLDWGGATLHDGMVKLESIDSPRSFFVSNPETILRRTRVFKADGELVSNQEGDAALRVVDAWLYNAQTTKSPHAMHRKALSVFPSSETLKSYRVSPDAVTLVGEKGTLRFTLGKNAAGYYVLRVDKVR